MNEKCRHPNCNETQDVHHYYYIPSRWGFECFWYCKEHKAYGKDLEKSETQKLLLTQAAIGHQTKFLELWNDTMIATRVQLTRAQKKSAIVVEAIQEKLPPLIPAYVEDVWDKPFEKKSAFVPNYGTENFKGSHKHTSGRIYKRPNREKRLKVIARDGNVCLKCGSTDWLVVDHIKPLALGGTNDYENLQTLCRTCDGQKGCTEKSYRKPLTEDDGFPVFYKEKDSFPDDFPDFPPLVTVSNCVHVSV